MAYKVTFVIALLSFFTLKANSFKEGCSLDDHKNDPSVTFVWKSKCNTHSTTYVCSGGFKPDATFLKDWKNNSQKHIVYEFSKTVEEELPYYFRTETIEPILEKSCNLGCFGHADLSLMNNDNFTCTKPNEQAITFYITSPDQSAGANWDYCDAAGGAELLGGVYPKAKWENHPALPHYYMYRASSVIESKRLFELIAKQREGSKGCRQYEIKKIENN